ncbi:phospholipase C, phosphocholine-specific [Pendulispora rubella]|uniref:phospholipase C n=1 Tax=Pendulispora rubella TaxID=2741070 RepID=A0ABZ2KQS3_9BACT
MSTDSKDITRRDFLAGLAGAAALTACGSEGDETPPPGGSPDAATGNPDGPSADGSPTNPRSGSIADIEHVIILMQENRSFDHYFGAMRGVRGFADRAAVPLRTGRNVLYQPDKWRIFDGQYLLPFHVDTKTTNGQQLADLAHGWSDQHNAVADGANDGWVNAKGELTMAYFTQADVPFHQALADAFTICDHNFCSVLGPTTPNRLHLFTGTIDADGKYGSPTTGNPSDYKPVLSWTTYPERLQEKGITWKVYSNHEVGDDPFGHPFVGDYGDNPLWLFHAYHDALKDPAKKDLADRAGVREEWEADSGKGKDVNHVLADFINDCNANALPKVSWIVAPYGYTEHPTARPVDGAAYIQGVLNALWAHPEIWAKTAVIINYDENDGFFDHVPPPMAPPNTPGEWVEGKPVGFGPRVPMLIISPWSRGGWVNSQVCDHTSVIRFLEKWTGVAEPNISNWRRTMSGDLTSCFDFSTKDTSIPELPDTAVLRKQADDAQGSLPPPLPPLPGKQKLPIQEPGTRKARPLPYQPVAKATVDVQNAKISLSVDNQGDAALQVFAYDALNLPTPGRYDVGPKGNATASISVTDGARKYALTVLGPNRFLAQFAGALDAPSAGVEVVPSLGGDPASPKLTLTFTNASATAVTVTVKALYYREDGPWTYVLEPGQSASNTWDPLGDSQGWYDLEASIEDEPSFYRRFSGRLENGREGVTG